MTNALPPADWAVDPSGRHEYRYWDGARWTDHVADGGAQALDPLGDEGEAGTGDTATADTAAETAADDAPADSPALDLLSASPPGTVLSTWPASGEAEPTVLVPPPPAPGSGQLGRGPIGSWTRDAWRGMDGLRTALVVLLIGCGVSALATMGTLATRVAAIEALGDGVTFARVQDLDDADDAVAAASAVALVLILATAVVWIVWQWRGAKNIEALGRESARFGPGWSIGGWFIPLANFVIPVMIMQGLWRDRTGHGAGIAVDRRTPLGAYRVVVGAAPRGNLLNRSITTEEIEPRDISNGRLDTDKFTATDTTAILGLGLTVIAAVLAIMVVVQLTRRFNERRAEESPV